MAAAGVILSVAVSFGRSESKGNSWPDATTIPVARPVARERPLVEAQLLADTMGIAPGQVFRLAVRLAIRPGWHVYWKNPGDAGLATTVRFTGPKGFKIGTIQWPTPKRFDQGGNIVGFGCAVKYGK